MVSREIITLPRVVPSQRTIAIPLTPTSSAMEEQRENVIVEATRDNDETTSAAVQSLDVSNVLVQIAMSSVELCVKNHQSDRRNRSQEEIKSSTMGTEIIHLLHSAHFSNKSNYKDSRKKRNCLLNEKDFYNTNINEQLKSKDKNIKNITNFYHRNVPERTNVHNLSNKLPNFKTNSNNTINDRELAVVINRWLNLLPIIKGNIVEKEFIFDYLFDLMKIRANVLDYNWKNKLKSDILNVLNIITIESQGNRRYISNKLADVLIENVKNLTKKKRNKKCHYRHHKECRTSIIKTCLPREKNELRSIVSHQVKLILDSNYYGLVINQLQVKEIENDLINIFSTCIETLYTKNEKHIKESVIQTLQNHGLSEQNATSFAEILLKHLKRVLVIQAKPTCVKSENFIVFPSLYNPTLLNRTVKKKKENISHNNQNKNTNSEIYINGLSKEIAEWITNLKLPKEEENNFVQVVVRELANDIFDRYKYLELNPDSRGSDEIEIEYLKYQIFKSVNKLVGENNLKSIEYAPELMSRIQRFFLSKSKIEQNNNSMNTSALTQNKRENKERSSIIGDDKKSTFHKNLRHISGITKNFSKFQSVSKEPQKFFTQKSASCSNFECNFTCLPTQITSNCCQNLKYSFKETPSSERLNEEYIQFVEEWVQQIPIISTPQDGVTAEKLRLGICNGIWKTLTTINCEPSVYRNKFLYEDVLDDAIEDLLNCLPQTPELAARKHCLKVQLIKRTTDTIDRIRAYEESYKHQLEQNVISVQKNYKGTDIENEQSNNIKNLVLKDLIDNYILFIRYKDENPIKADVYKNKFMNKIDDIFEQIQESDDNNSVDFNSFKNDIINAVQKVSLPNENIINNEVDDIFIELEVDRWISDLPIEFDNHEIEQQQIKQLKDITTNIVKQMGNGTVLDAFFENELKNSIHDFFRTAPLKKETDLNFDFVINEFVNRIRNCPKSGTNQNTRRVAFIEPQGYKDFKQDVAFTSSLLEPVLNKHSVNAHKDYDISNKSCCESVGKPLTNNFHGVDSSKQWYAVPDSRNSFINNVSDSNSHSPGSINEPNQWHTLRNSSHPANNNISINRSNSSLADTSSKQWHTLQDSCCPINNKVSPNISNGPTSIKHPFDQLHSLHDSCSLVNNNIPHKIATAAEGSKEGKKVDHPSKKWRTLQDNCWAINNNNSHNSSNATVEVNCQLKQRSILKDSCCPINDVSKNIPIIPVEEDCQSNKLNTSRNRVCSINNDVSCETNKSMKEIDDPSDDIQKAVLNSQANRKHVETQLPDFPFAIRENRENSNHTPNILSPESKRSNTILSPRNLSCCEGPKNNLIKKQCIKKSDPPLFIKTENETRNVTQSNPAAKEIPCPIHVQLKNDNSKIGIPISHNNFIHTDDDINTSSIRNCYELNQREVLNQTEILTQTNLTKTLPINNKISSSDDRNCSVGCQIETDPTSISNSEELTRSVGIAVSVTDFDPCEAGTSTPQHSICQAIPLKPSKKRRKSFMLGRDAVKKRLNLDDSEDDDEIPCRCFERYWKYKCKGRFPCESFENYPPFLPMFYPFPYFL